MDIIRVLRERNMLSCLWTGSACVHVCMTLDDPTHAVLQFVSWSAVKRMVAVHHRRKAVIDSMVVTPLTQADPSCSVRWSAGR